MYSKVSGEITSSATVELNAKVARFLREGRDVISLNIGEPDFPTPKNVSEAAVRAIEEGFTRYTPVNGIPELREAITVKLQKDNALAYTPDEVCVSAGAKQALYNALLVLVQQGDEVIVPTPCWVSYVEMIKLAGAVPVLVPMNSTEGYVLDAEALERAVTTRTKAIVINSPNNPTGAVYREREMEALAELVCKYNLHLISDEVYEKYIFRDAKHISPASLSEEMKKRTVVINGCSKTYAMTGWRIGYAAGVRELINRMKKIQGHTTSAPSSVSQKAAGEALTGSQESIAKMKEAFSQRREFLMKRLGNLEGVKCPSCDGAFYLLPDFSAYLGKKAGGCRLTGTLELADFLLEEAGIAVVPGDSFFAPGCLRISYSNSMEALEKAMERMEAALGKVR